MSKYQHIYNAIGDVVFILHARSGKVLFANDRCQEVYGYTPEQIVKSGFSMLLVDDLAYGVQKAGVYLRKAADGTEQVFEWKAKHANGTVFWVEVRLNSIILDGQKRVMAIVRNITDLKRSTEALKRSEQFQKAVNFFSSSLIHKNSEEEILWDVVLNCVEVLDFEDVVIYVKRDSKLIQVAAYGEKTINGKVSEQLTLSVGEGIVGDVARTGTGEIVNDLTKDERYIVDVVRRKSEITVPIKYQGEVLGIIDSEHPQRDFFTNLHLEVIEAIASLAAIKVIHARSEEEVRRSEKRLKSILESSPDMIFVLDEDGVYKEVYTNNEDLLAAPKEKLIGSNIEEFFSKEDVIGIRESIQKVLKTRKPESEEYTRQNRNGKKRWFSAQIAFFEYQDGPSVILLSRDITDKRRAQSEIIESQKLLASINHNISEGIYRSHADGGLVYANHSFITMFGYDSLDEMLALKSQDLYAHPLDRSGLTDAIKSAVFRSNVEVLYKRKDGSTFWGLNSYILTKDQEGRDIFDGAIRDVSKQKKSAEQLGELNNELLSQNRTLAQKEQELATFNQELISNRDNLVDILEELSDRNFELDQLVYKTSHDLRAPLRSVLGLTNLYRLEVDNPPNSYVQKIEDRIHKMDEFIKSMLDYSRGSRLSVKNTQVDIGDLLDGCLSDLGFLEGFDAVEIIKNINSHKYQAMTDELRLKIILSNIISNVFKYRKVEDVSSFMKIDVEVLKDEINISVEDNGIGIAKEYISKVFDMFYRATDRSDGSGLGMYIVKQSIDKLGGSITVESEEGVGTIFRVSLPNQPKT
jgi:PAS domain S-box-containing protein